MGFIILAQHISAKPCLKLALFFHKSNISCLHNPCPTYFSKASLKSELFFHKVSLKSDIEILKNSSKITQDQNNFTSWVKGHSAWKDIQSRPHSIVEVAALGHSNIHSDFCFDLMFHLFFISPWIALGFQFNFEMIFTLIMQLLLLLNLLATSFYFQSFFFLCFAVTFHFTFSFDLFFLLFFIKS